MTKQAADERIWSIFASQFNYPCLLLADEVGLFSALAKKPRKIAEIAQDLDLTFRLSVALVAKMSALGLLTTGADGKWSPTPEALEYTTPGAKNYWGPMWVLSKKTNPLFQETMKSIEVDRQNKGAPHAIGQSWREGKINLDLARAYAFGIHAQAGASVGAAAALPVFAGVERLLDVGSGPGTFAIELAKHNPKVVTTLLDLEPILAIADEFATEAGCADRLVHRVGNFFKDAWSTGHDGVMLSNIFHNWGESDCKFFAKNAHASLEKGGKIFIHQILLNDDYSGPDIAASFCFAMYNRYEGRQYSFAEIKSWLAETGFTKIERVDAAGAYSLIVGEKA